MRFDQKLSMAVKSVLRDEIAENREFDTTEIMARLGIEGRDALYILMREELLGGTHWYYSEMVSEDIEATSAIDEHLGTGDVFALKNELLKCREHYDRQNLTSIIDQCAPIARAQIFHESDAPLVSPDDKAAIDAGVPNGREL